MRRDNTARRRHRRSSRIGVLSLAMAVLAVTAMGSAGASDVPDVRYEGEAGGEGGLAAAESDPVRITLVTGDQVVMGSEDRASVIPGEGRERVAFRKMTVGGHLHVVPSDVAGLVSAGVLDARLFDVTMLAESGYDDATRETLPLIVSASGASDASAGSDAGTLRQADGAEVVRALPAIDGVAVEVDKDEAAGFLAALTTGRTESGSADVGTMAAGVERVWLDGPVEALLEESVPQIGAPAAWDSGFTGEGVTVAVLDTGIDVGHPDLADKVVASKNFTESSDLDMVGHGSHVASTIAGTGAASDGRYTGVAPEADLLNGKVLDDEGFATESQIIAGMEWATIERGADVVNMSLGFPTHPLADLADDPLRMAVDRLTERTGALFAVAAGNDGPGDGRYGTIGTPASADAAITVGAVDKSDELAWFSSTGPRANDGGLKPDITAPGEQITAAGPYTISGTYYQTLDGTSMAAPHVAGAAALLKQRNPGWDADELKAALMSSADPHPDLSAYQQGAGRVDIASALGRTVVSVPASINVGSVRWPHTDDEPVTRKLTYRNDGDTDVTLSFEADLSDASGSPAPGGAVELSTTTLVVPAGGTAAVQVVVDTGHDGPDGVYTGRVTATGAGDTRLVTPIAVDKEVESYDLTLESIDRDGGAALIDTLVLETHPDLGREEARQHYLAGRYGPITLRLPKGDYLLDTWVRPDDDADLSWMVQPKLTLDADTTVVADARDARPFDLDVERDSAEPLWLGLGYQRTTTSARFRNGLTVPGADAFYTAHLGPELGDEEFATGFAATFADPGEDGSFANTPYLYALADRLHGRFWTGHTASFADRDLAGVRIAHHSQVAAGSVGYRYLDGFDTVTSTGIFAFFRLDLPATVKLYTTDHLSWSTSMEEVVELPDGEEEYVMSLREDQSLVYAPGRHYIERWNNAVVGPMLDEQFKSSGWVLDQLEVYLSPTADGSGNRGFSPLDSGSTRLYRNGELIAESEEAGQVFAEQVPSERAEFRLESSAERLVARFSTEQRTVWEFTADPPAGDELETLPLWMPRITPDVDGSNASSKRRFALVPIEYRPEVDAEVGRLRDPKVWASFDDGDTWGRVPVLPAPGENTWRALIRHPTGGGPEYVSLRTVASDSDGNSVDHTVIHAYALR